jgi:hypothetical protein
MATGREATNKPVPIFFNTRILCRVKTRWRRMEEDDDPVIVVVAVGGREEDDIDDDGMDGTGRRCSSC